VLDTFVLLQPNNDLIPNIVRYLMTQRQGDAWETTQETAAACPSCEVVSTSVKARVITSPRDIGCRQDRIVVRWNKTRWRCREDYCGRSSFTEAIAQVPARARTTRRLRTQRADPPNNTT